MKLKIAILMIVTTSFLIGCGESQDVTSQKSNQVSAPAKTETAVTPKATPEPEQHATAEATPEPEQHMTAKATPAQSTGVVPQEKLEADAKSLAKALAYEGDEIPQEQLEQEIKEILEAANAESAAAGNGM